MSKTTLKLGNKMRTVPINEKDDKIQSIGPTIYVVWFKDWVDGITLFDSLGSALESVRISWSNADPKAVVRQAYPGKWNIWIDEEIIGFITTQAVLKEATHL